MIAGFKRVGGRVIEPNQNLWWATKDAFNPGAVVRNGQVCLLVRGEDDIGRFWGTSRIGLATSADGVSFDIEREPVLGPGDDDCAQWEAEGGCEDPRVVETPDGSYVCTYTGFEGTRPTLMVATSPDLRTWTKRGPAFAGTAYAERSAKSGAIVTVPVDGRLVATQVNGQYWMYWGEGTTYCATSDDLIRWTPVDHDATADRRLRLEDGRWSVDWKPGIRVLLPILHPRANAFDSLLTEPGPPAVFTDDGIVLIYNGANFNRIYCPAQAVFDPRDPTVCIARAREPFLVPESEDETRGQVDNVCFAEGLVIHNGEWRLYFGMADSRIGCAVAPV